MYLPLPRTTLPQPNVGKTHRETALLLAFQLLIVLLFVSAGISLVFIALGRGRRDEERPPLHAAEEGMFQPPVPATPYSNVPPRRRRRKPIAKLEEKQSAMTSGSYISSRDLDSA